EEEDVGHAFGSGNSTTLLASISLVDVALTMVKRALREGDAAATKIGGLRHLETKRTKLLNNRGSPLSDCRELAGSRCSYGAIAALSCSKEPDCIVDGSTRSVPDTTMAVRVLSIKALTSACSAAGTENLSSVACTSSMNACHSVGVIARWRWESSMVRPE